MSNYDLVMMKAQKRKEGADLMKSLTHSLNSFSYEQDVIEGFCEQFMKEHATLSAGVMRAFVHLCQRTAQNERKMTDGRFVGCSSLVKEVVEWSENNGIPYI